MEQTLGAIGLIGVIFAIVVGILWIIIPFLIMGVNKRLDKLNKNLIKIGRILREQQQEGGS